MKVGIDISQIVFAGTGVATYTRNLVENIVKQDQKNEYVLFGSSLRQQKILNDFLPNINHKIFPIPPTVMETIWNRFHILPVENLIGKVNVFHSSDWTESPSKAKKVTTVHDLIVYKFPKSSDPGIIAAQKRKLTWAKKEEAAFIAVSKATKKDIVEILGVPEEKITVIYEAARDIFKKSNKKNSDKPYILAVGTREPRKNLDRLVKAYESLNLKDVDLVIAGKFGWGPSTSLRIKSSVKVLGYIPPEKLVDLYSNALCFAYPSIYEGFGIPILEAFNCECPVITSDISSMPEVGGNAAIYADPLSVSDIAEKLRFVLELSQSKCKVLIQKGLDQAKKFSWEKAAQETIKIYESLV